MWEHLKRKLAKTFLASQQGVKALFSLPHPICITSTLRIAPIGQRWTWNSLARLLTSQTSNHKVGPWQTLLVEHPVSWFLSVCQRRSPSSNSDMHPRARATTCLQDTSTRDLDKLQVLRLGMSSS